MFFIIILLFSNPTIRTKDPALALPFFIIAKETNVTKKDKILPQISPFDANQPMHVVYVTQLKHVKAIGSDPRSASKASRP